MTEQITRRTLRERIDLAAEAIGKLFDPRGGWAANTPVTDTDAGLWINVREARALLAVVEAVRDANASSGDLGMFWIPIRAALEGYEKEELGEQ